MKTLRLIILLFFLTINSFSQKRTYLGLETAITNDVFEIVEYGNELQQAPLIGGRLGLSVHQDLNDFFSFEIGFTFKRYKEGFGFRTVSGYGTSSAVSAFCFPIRLHSKINLLKNKIFLTPLVGLTYGIIPGSYSTGGAYGKMSSGTDSVTFISYSEYGIAQSLILIQAGLSIDFVFKNNSSLTISSSYYSGLTKIYRTNVTYQINDKPWANGQGFSKGTFWDVIGIQYKFPISNWWQKKQ